MSRPFKRRCINIDPSTYYFKPRGIPLSELKEVTLALDELEAIRLKDVEKYDQQDCAKKMNISQSTFQRVLAKAREKIAHALVLGEAIRIQTKET